MADFNTM